MRYKLVTTFQKEGHKRPSKIICIKSTMAEALDQQEQNRAWIENCGHKFVDYIIKEVV